MQDTAKYLIHARIEASGVVERSDVVGAIFGQTEGLLGEDLDLRTLQESSKVGRIDVEIDSADGHSHGEVTIASGLDRVETAILAASLEAIDRVGPCRADVEVTHLEDVRKAKRREIVDRAEDLLAQFDEEVVSSEELVEEVRRRARVDRITTYEGLPAGPRVTDSDAIIVVEGRADVLTLLEYGIKNAVAVEGTDVPDAVADLTRERTVTAFLDGDRGGDLILRELAQVGNVDYVAFAPEGKSVEDLSRSAVTGALREKVLYEALAEGRTAEPEGGDETQASEAATDETDDEPTAAGAAEQDADGAAGAGVDGVATDGEGGVTTADVEATASAGEETGSDTDRAVAAGDAGVAAGDTLDDHVQAVIGDGTGAVRLLDDSLATLAEAPAAEAFEAVRDADPEPATVVLDGEVSQALLDVAAQRGVGRLIGTSTAEFVKQPTGVRVSTVGEA